MKTKIIHSLGIVTLFVSVISSAQARDLKFTLDCEWYGNSANPPAGAPTYRILKIVTRVAGKWTHSYKLEVQPTNPTAATLIYDFKHAGSGDEGYDDFYTVDRDKESGIYAASIGTKFKTAHLEGYQDGVYYRCSSN